MMVILFKCQRSRCVVNNECSSQVSDCRTKTLTFFFHVNMTSNMLTTKIINNGCDYMIVGLTSTCVISAYHPLCFLSVCGGVYWMQRLLVIYGRISSDTDSFLLQHDITEIFLTVALKYQFL